ncbi:MAG: hemolysin family protein [Rhodospirillales bacterium]|nr:hemolysin family protein [Rhodospirillales bacterium]
MNEKPPLDAPKTDDEPPSGQARPGDRLRGWLKGLRNNAHNGDTPLHDTVEEIIEQHEENDAAVDSDARAMIDKVLKVGGLTVHDIMIPRADIVAVEMATSRDELTKLMVEEAHSRVPVFRETLDDVIGMVHIKDVLAAITEKQPFELSKIVRKVLIVSPSMRVLDMLLQMRLDRTHMALVVDEYGGIDGLTTIEDLVEQIVGEIEDEHDVVEGPHLHDQGDGTLVADARLTIREFEERVGSVLTEEEHEDDIDTLGGLVFSLTGRIPLRGEVVRHEPSGIEFEVMEADARRIRRLHVCNLPARRSAHG